jgi:hypothetical protein
MTTAGTTKNGELRLRPWEPMTLTSVGTFGDVMLGNTGTKSDHPNTTKK